MRHAVARRLLGDERRGDELRNVLARLVPQIILVGEREKEVFPAGSLEIVGVARRDRAQCAPVRRCTPRRRDTASRTGRSVLDEPHRGRRRATGSRRSSTHQSTRRPMSRAVDVMNCHMPTAAASSRRSGRSRSRRARDSTCPPAVRRRASWRGSSARSAFLARGCSMCFGRAGEHADVAFDARPRLVRVDLDVPHGALAAAVDSLGAAAVFVESPNRSVIRLLTSLLERPAESPAGRGDAATTG